MPAGLHSVIGYFCFCCDKFALLVKKSSLTAPVVKYANNWIKESNRSITRWFPWIGWHTAHSLQRQYFTHHNWISLVKSNKCRVVQSLWKLFLQLDWLLVQRVKHCVQCSAPLFNQCNQCLLSKSSAITPNRANYAIVCLTKTLKLKGVRHNWTKPQLWTLRLNQWFASWLMSIFTVHLYKCLFFKFSFSL